MSKQFNIVIVGGGIAGLATVSLVLNIILVI
jgi:flavin-dependent dehydrogenase